MLSKTTRAFARPISTTLRQSIPRTRYNTTTRPTATHTINKRQLNTTSNNNNPTSQQQQPTTTHNEPPTQQQQQQATVGQQPEQIIIHHKVNFNDPNLFIEPPQSRVKGFLKRTLISTIATTALTVVGAQVASHSTASLVEDYVSKRFFQKHFLQNVNPEQFPVDLQNLGNIMIDPTFNKIDLLVKPEPDSDSIDYRVRNHNALLQQLIINQQLVNTLSATLDYCAQLDVAYQGNPCFESLQVWNPVLNKVEVQNPRSDLKDLCANLRDFVYGWAPQGHMLLRWFTRDVNQLYNEYHNGLGTDPTASILGKIFNYKKFVLELFFPGYGHDSNYINNPEKVDLGPDADQIPDDIQLVAESNKKISGFDLLLNSSLSAIVSANVALKNDLKHLQHYILYIQTIANEESLNQISFPPPPDFPRYPGLDETWTVVPDFKHLYAHLYDEQLDESQQQQDNPTLKVHQFSGIKHTSLYTLLLHSLPQYQTPTIRPLDHIKEEDNVASLITSNTSRLGVWNQLVNKYIAHNSESIQNYANDNYNVVDDGKFIKLRTFSPLPKLLQKHSVQNNNKVQLELPILHKTEIDSLHEPYAPHQVIRFEEFPGLDFKSDKSIFYQLRQPEVVDPWALTPYNNAKRAMEILEKQQQTGLADSLSFTQEAFGYTDVCSINFQHEQNTFKPDSFPASFLFYEYNSPNRFPTKLLSLRNTNKLSSTIDAQTAIDNLAQQGEAKM